MDKVSLVGFSTTLKTIPSFQSQSIIKTTVIPGYSQGQTHIPQPCCFSQTSIHTWKPFHSESSTQKSSYPSQGRPPDLLSCPTRKSEGASQARYTRGEKRWVQQQFFFEKLKKEHQSRFPYFQFKTIRN